MPIELLDKSEQKDEIDENVVEVCERLIRRLANLPLESFQFVGTRDRHAVELWPENKVLKRIPVEEVTQCLKMVAVPRALRVREAMAFRMAMRLVADVSPDQMDLRVQIIKSLCEAFDFPH